MIPYHFSCQVRHVPLKIVPREFQKYSFSRCMHRIVGPRISKFVREKWIKSGNFFLSFFSYVSLWFYYRRFLFSFTLAHKRSFPIIPITITLLVSGFSSINTSTASLHRRFFPFHCFYFLLLYHSSVSPPSFIIRPFCIEKISLAGKCEIFHLFYGSISIKILATRKRRMYVD